MTAPDLSPKLLATLLAFAAFFRAHHYAPATRQVQVPPPYDVASSCAIQARLVSLEKLGYLGCGIGPTGKRVAHARFLTAKAEQLLKEDLCSPLDIAASPPSSSGCSPGSPSPRETPRPRSGSPATPAVKTIHRRSRSSSGYSRSRSQ